MRPAKILKNKVWSKKAMTLYLFVIILSLSVFYIHFTIIDMQKTDSSLINLAGRQRMLTQMLAKELLLFHKTINPNLDREKIKKNIKVFDLTLKAMLNGGQAPLDLSLKKYVQLPKAKNVLITKQLGKVFRLWKQSRRGFLIFIARNDFKHSHVFIKDCDELLKRMEKVVFLMQAAAEKNNYTINLILHLTYLLVVVVVLILFIFNIYRLKHTKAYIKHLELILPICSICKKIREPNSDPRRQMSWTEIEGYIEERSESMFSHSICPSCEKELYGKEDWYLKRAKNKEKP